MYLTNSDSIFKIISKYLLYGSGSIAVTYIISYWPFIFIHQFYLDISRYNTGLEVLGIYQKYSSLKLTLNPPAIGLILSPYSTRLYSCPS